VRAALGTTADTAKSANTLQKAALATFFTTPATKSGVSSLRDTDQAACRPTFMACTAARLAVQKKKKKGCYTAFTQLRCKGTAG